MLVRWLQSSFFLTFAMYLMITLLASVFPLPDSPTNIISNTCTRYHSSLTRNNNASVLSIPSHRFVGSIRYGKYVGWPFKDFSTFNKNYIISSKLKGCMNCFKLQIMLLKDYIAYNISSFSNPSELANTTCTKSC